jgi:hypothetical protein
MSQRTWTDSLDKRPKLRNMDIRLGVWNVRSLHRSGPLMTVVEETGDQVGKG